MPAPSPLAAIQNLSLRITIKIDGDAMNDAYGITSISINHAVNRISQAEIILQGEVDIDSGEMPLSDGADFQPGKSIVISAGYGDSGETTIFSGVIVKQSVEIDQSQGYSFRILCKHKAVSMTFNRNEATFSNKTDSAIIQAVVGNYSTISCSVDATSVSMPFVFQHMSTDWDFILSRAEFNGYIITTNEDKLVIGKPLLSSSAVLKLAIGDSVISFSAEISAEDQPPSLTTYAWDPKTQARLTSTAAEPSLNEQGALSPKTLSTFLSQTELSMVSPIPMTTDELKVWADGSLLRKRLSAFKGTVKFIGSALVKPGDLVELDGVGKKFNGDAFVSSVTHTIDEELWNTTVRFGLENVQINQRPNFSFSPAGGQLPAIHGLQIGVVKKLSSDPDGENRIQVEISSNATTPALVWARFVNFYATNNAGSGFLPEVGDEVAIGFLDNDPRFPVILGSMYSSKNVSPNTPPDENNYIKSITTKAKIKITLDDEKKIITIETPGANKIIISDDQKSIELKDQNGNSVKLSASGIDLNSPKDINIKATGSISLTATAKVNITAQQDVIVSGLNVNATANIGFAAKGNATAELTASGQTTIKGGIVMIN